MPSSTTNLILRAKRELEGAIDAILDPLHLITSDFKILRANKAFAAACKMDIREVPGKTCHQAFMKREEPCEECPLVGRLLYDNNEVGQILHEETEISVSDRVYRMSPYLFKSAEGAPLLICYYRDVSREKLLQRQVLQSEKLAAVGQLAGGVAHEINNPLGVIYSFAQLASTRAAMLGDEELTDDLSEILKAAERCKKIVRGLLDFSRPAKEEEIASVALSKLLSDSLFLVKTQFKKLRVSVIENYEEALPLVWGNENKLQQVAINLIQNAFQAVTDQGILEISTKTVEPEWVQIEISDNGQGISPESINRIFEPFFTTKKIGDGTGLGLSISYGIISEHGGTIEVRSELGLGTTFTIKLPSIIS
jgi:two-component system, NtrC family, sensor kinase